MTNNALFLLFKGVNPHETTFWTGAGISMQHPTSLPSGASLTKLCTNAFMPKSTLNLIKRLFSFGKFKDSYGNLKTLPRLELIIEDIVGVLGFQTFEYFSFMKIPKQYLNVHHYFFANHINKGGKHFTMNFDNGIETAILNVNDKVMNNPNEEKLLQSRLIKLHGTITEKNSYKNLGITLKNITMGFSNDLANNILDILAESKILCFIGYGGVDSFDVTPFFDLFIANSGKNKLKNLTVIWISHLNNGDLDPCSPDEIPNSAPMILKALENSGAKIYPYKGNAIKLIPILENLWGWTPKKSLTKATYDWKTIFNNRLKTNPTPKDFKHLIAGQYMAALGAGKKAIYFCMSSKSLSSQSNITEPRRGIYTSLTTQWWRVYTNGLRDWGKHKEAIKRIKEWIKYADSPFNKFFAVSRLMGEYRMSGNYIKAYLIYKKSLKVLKKNKLKHTTNPDELYVIGDFWITYLHVHRDLWKRYKRIKNILLKPWRDIITKAWIEAFFINRKRPFPRYSTQLYDLAVRVFDETDYFLKQAKLKDPSIPEKIENGLITTDISNFLETDSLLGDINYQREHIIDKRKVRSSLINEIKNNLSKAEVIDDWPGVWKAYYRLAREYFTLQKFTLADKNARYALAYMRKVEYSLYFRLDYAIRLWKIIIKSKLQGIRPSSYPH